MRGAYSLGPGSEIGLIVCAADLRRFRLRFLGHSLSLVVDCSSNRLDGRLTFQKGFNRAFGLSAFLSSTGRQRPYPIPPLLPQLAESTLIPFPYQIDFAMYGNDVMDLTSAGLRSM
jgi:hypothetical protein